MLAEIFMLRLEATARAAKEAATITRSTSPFVPVTLPPVRRPKSHSLVQVFAAIEPRTDGRQKPDYIEQPGWAIARACDDLANTEKPVP
jgi:hypothetical protein